MKVTGYEIPKPVLVKTSRWFKRRDDFEKDDLVRYLLTVGRKANDGSLLARTYRTAGALIQAWKRQGLVTKVPRTRKWQVAQ